MMVDDSILICKKSNCTLSQTGKCILEHDPQTCPDRLLSLSEGDQVLPAAIDEALLEPVTNIETFAGSYTLNILQVEKLMQSRYSTVIGILGAPNAGKTACLVSLYLLLAHDQLKGFQFRNSKTIRAFEDISRGARWTSAKPDDEMTLHTEISDGRTPGFLHLRAKSSSENDVFDFLFPDLPGEWTNTFITQNRYDRLNFLKAADCLWIMVNGEEIAEKASRPHAIHRLTLLFDRISELVVDPIPIILVITRKDSGAIDGHLYKKFKDKVEEKGFKFNAITIASFSNADDISAGSGISELIQTSILPFNSYKSEFWDFKQSNTTACRQMLKYS